MLDTEVLEKCLESGAKAPSGDNVQPWRVEVDQGRNTVWVFNRPERDPSYFNYKQLASCVALGAFCENFSLEAAEQGFETQLKPFPKGLDGDCAAELVLRPSAKRPITLQSAIGKRCTQRTFFKGGVLTSAQKDSLDAQVEGLDCRLVVLEGESLKKAAGCLGLNDRFVFEHRAIHRFLFEQIRWSEAEANSTGNGMPTTTLGLNPVERLMFPMLAKWKFISAMNHVGLSRIIGLKGRILCRSSAALGFLLIKKNDCLGFFEAGRAFERIWLQATLDGYGFQPITGFTFLLQRLKDGALDGFSKRQAEALLAVEQRLEGIITPKNDELIALGFRIGKVGDPKGRTTRLPVEVKFVQGDTS